MTALKKIFIIVFCILTTTTFIPKNCFGLVKDWTRVWGSGVNNFGGESVAMDSNCNSYVTGKTYWHFDGQTNYAIYNIFLTKYNRFGEKQWSRIWGPTNAARSEAAVGYDVSIDSASNCYVTGETYGQFDGQGEANSYNIFLTKYNSSGTKLWTKIWGSTNGYDTGRSVSIGADGYCYVAGYTDGEFDGQTNNGDAHIFLTKLSLSGTRIWTRICVTTEVEYAYAVSASVGVIYITGYTMNKFDQTSRDFFLTKFSDTGIEQWKQIWGSDTYDYGEGVAADSAGNCYVAGHTFGEFDGQTNSKMNSYDICLSKFNSSGSKLWTRIWGNGNPINGLGQDYGKDVSVDSFGNAYVVGYTDGSFDGQTNSGSWDIFLTKYNSSGFKKWSEIWGAGSADMGGAVAVSSSGSVCYVTGYTDAWIIDGQTNTNGESIFLTKFVASIPPSDTFNSANTLPNDAGITEGNNSGATTESGEPEHAGNGGPYHSVWWDWSEPTSTMSIESAAGDTFIIDTHGSDFDTVLAVYTGLAVSDLTIVATNDNSGTGIETSEVSFQFDSGQTYHIAVDGKTGVDTGNVVLNYEVIPEPSFCLSFVIYYFLFINRKFNRRMTG